MNKALDKAFPHMAAEERAAHEARRGTEKTPVLLIAATFAVLGVIAYASFAGWLE